MLTENGQRNKHNQQEVANKVSKIGKKNFRALIVQFDRIIKPVFFSFLPLVLSEDWQRIEHNQEDNIKFKRNSKGKKRKKKSKASSM